MARRKSFLDSALAGFNAGTSIAKAYEDTSKKAELKEANKTDQSQVAQYTPEQVKSFEGDSQAQAGETWSEADQGYQSASGLRTPQNVPTYQDGGYKQTDGATVAPATRYALGNRTQDTAFTADDIATEKLNRKADIYSNYGDEATAESMRGSALTRGLQQRQLAKLDSDTARDDEMKKAHELVQGHDADTEKVAAPIIQAVKEGKMSMQVAMPQILHGYNQNLPNGEQIGYDQNKGHLYKTTNGRVEQLRGTDGKPLVVDAEHLDQFMGLSKARSEKYLDQVHAKLYPELYMDRKKIEQQATQFNQTRTDGRDDAASVNSRFDKTYAQSESQFQQTKDFEMAKHNDTNAIAQQNADNMGAYYRAGASGRLNGAPLNEAQAYALEQQRGFDAKVNAIQDKVDKGEITQAAGDKLMTSANRRLGFNPTADKPAKPWTTTDAKNVEELLSQQPDWAKAPEAVKKERRAAAKAEFTGSDTTTTPVSLLDAAAADGKKSVTAKPRGHAPSDAAILPAKAKWDGRPEAEPSWGVAPTQAEMFRKATGLVVKQPWQ